jgi:hypothetical protein
MVAVTDRAASVFSYTDLPADLASFLRQQAERIRATKQLRPMLLALSLPEARI